MASNRRARLSCQCSRSLPISSIFLFLSVILPSSSFAQLTSSAIPSTSTNIPISTTSTRSPRISPSSTFPPPAPSPKQTDPNATNTSAANTQGEVSNHVFNFYFLIIAAVAILFCLCILYLGRRKKRKAAIMRSRGQRALARDVEGFRSRFGMGRTGIYNVGTNGRNDIEEGLDERGEAPPPYVPGSKPPSVRIGDGLGQRRSPEPRAGTIVELTPLDGAVDRPPGYHEHGDSTSDENVGVSRPDTAVTTSERFGSMRRLLSRM